MTLGKMKDKWKAKRLKKQREDTRRRNEVRKALSIEEIKKKRQIRAKEAKEAKEKEEEQEVLVLESMDSQEQQDYDELVKMFGEDIAKEKIKEKTKVPNTKPSNDLEDVVKQ